MSGGVVVFAGLTLPSRAVTAALPCRCLPPAAQGDVWRAVRTWRPRVIGLIDGVFLDVGAVWHRELLWALTRGVHVWGAASMGALRAAELQAFGMVGVGRIFAAYRDRRFPGFPEPFEDDDEVAVVHAPMQAGGGAMSDAMVDLRASLLAAEAAGVIDRAICIDLAAAMKRLHFPQRSFAALAAAGPAALRDWLPAHAVRQKREDALTLLDAIGSMSEAPPFQPGFRLQRALVWERFVAEAERQERGAGPASLQQPDISAWLDAP